MVKIDLKIYIDAKDKRALKIRAVNRGITLAALVRELIKKHLAEKLAPAEVQP